MVLYSPVKDTNGSTGLAVAGPDTSSYTMALAFSVNTSGLVINGVWWWCDVASGQYTNSLGDESIALWIPTGLASASYVAGSALAITGAYAQGWNLLTFTAPIALTSGQEYLAVKGVSSAHQATNNYSAASNFFKVAGSGANGFSEGPVLVYSSGLASQLGSTNLEPNGNNQMSFAAGAVNSAPPNITTTVPNSSGFHGGWYGLDVQVASSSPGQQSQAGATSDDRNRVYNKLRSFGIVG